jgi:hypothetical protein
VISRANATSSAVVAPPRLISASECLVEMPTLPRVSPLWKPERSISHAALVFTRPCGSGKRGGSPSIASNAASSRIGLVKNEPADTVSGSSESITMPLPRRSASTASRTSCSGARSASSARVSSA